MKNYPASREATHLCEKGGMNCFQCTVLLLVQATKWTDTISCCIKIVHEILWVVSLTKMG